MRNFILLFTAYLLVSCTPDNTETGTPTLPADQAQILLDVSYGQNAMQKYDLYLPAGRSKQTTKVIVMIHGGGWIEGDKADVNGFVELIKQHNNDYAIVNMNYILADDTRNAYPSQIEDIQAVINDLKSRATTYQIRTKFGFVGVSAGGNLSLVYSYAFDTNNDVEMVCSIVGPADLTDSYYTENPAFQEAFSVLVGEFGPQNIGELEEISPSYLVQDLSPPTILFYGNMDTLIPNTQHQSLKTALENNNVIHSVSIYDGGHTDWDAASYIDLDSKLNTFITTHL